MQGGGQGLLHRGRRAPHHPGEVPQPRPLFRHPAALGHRRGGGHPGGARRYAPARAWNRQGRGGRRPARVRPRRTYQVLRGQAISRYETEGPEATLAHYSRPESVDGQWYVFFIDQNDLSIAHPDPGRIGLDLNGWAGTDANGYNYGTQMLSATENGAWVSYVYQNPHSGDIDSADFSELQLKNT